LTILGLSVLIVLLTKQIEGDSLRSKTNWRGLV